ncbi:MAG: chorismate synthase, partial [Candidatus Diapherotrites archaeon]|nr:chorismate synthase [Candidatus Diapherotrites archaeon]
MTFSFGTCLKMKLFGESHGPCVGVTIEGFPVGIKIKLDQIQTELDKRKPGQSLLTTQRKELDQLEVQSGLFENKSTGSPITMLVKNQDNISAHYDELKITPRPGHADFPAQVKYNGLNDHRGGGIFSGRMTAGIVMAGALAKQLPEMQGIQITTYIKQIGSIRSENNQGLTLEMEKLIL